MSEIKYLDINTVADKGLNWNVFVGARRIGKTYGILKRFMETGIRFIYMRRTETELITAINEGIFTELNADLGKEYNVDYSKSAGMGVIYADAEKQNPIGKALAMSTVRKVRGVTFTGYEELFYDEFIPEESAPQSYTDGITCVQAFETIFSNRELPPHNLLPMRVWLAANAINLYDPILNSLNLVDEVAKMGTAGIKTRSIPERSLYLYYGTEDSVADAKKATSLYALIGADSETADHILKGNFRGSDISLLRKYVDFKKYKCIFDIDGEIFVYMDKNDNSWYVSRVKQPTKMHFTKKTPAIIRRKFAPRYQILKGVDMVTYADATLIAAMNALLA